MLFLFYVKVYVCRLYCIVLYCITLYYNLIKNFQIKKKKKFILLRSLDLFHKEMGRSNLLERLHLIKEQLCDTNQGYPAYPTNRPFTGLNENLKTCRHCKRDTLRLRLFSNELCCENCGLLEPLDGVAFDYNENVSLWWGSQGG